MDEIDWPVIIFIPILIAVFNFWGPWWGMATFVVGLIALGWSKRHE